MNEYVQLGAPPEKLVLGLHGAGSSFTLESMANHNVGDKVSAGGKAGPLLKLVGRMAYTEVRYSMGCCVCSLIYKCNAFNICNIYYADKKQNKKKL